MSTFSETLLKVDTRRGIPQLSKYPLSTVEVSDTDWFLRKGVVIGNASCDESCQGQLLASSEGRRRKDRTDNFWLKLMMLLMLCRDFLVLIDKSLDGNVDGVPFIMSNDLQDRTHLSKVPSCSVLPYAKSVHGFLIMISKSSKCANRRCL